ncbi:hypothetical protein BABINDRAFT_8356 [Babjeviella inositovora NRRL Y-12698]|uniref:Uncharacterized protein n=1 Tax=Babjeviella inositovora NRRL Y-12698 TaxID=984486 RepID=A0A1E3QR34_9ASCO|nr:uncharacterized protein BABINDRAFT_8356 [Babjeviella inositovora NRRL Y-12698]ODQ79417.1 hypothetical protein BABINDRAFT_8356 [Babjeviella inositovora NRRL Y-12698]
MFTIDILTQYFWKFDALVTAQFSRNAILSAHTDTFTGKYITLVVLTTFTVVLVYQTIYSIGLRLDWWEYHAKEIFRELPVHCAHLYVDVNVVQTPSDKGLQLALLSKNTKTPQYKAICAFPRPIRYNIEFGPEDFDLKHNDDPEFGYGSKLDHLRGKILLLIKGISVKEGHLESLERASASSVRVFKNGKEFSVDQDGEYLCILGIETGNRILAFIEIEATNSL